MYTHIYIYIYVYIPVYIKTIYIYIYVYTCLEVYIYIYMYVCGRIPYKFKFNLRKITCIIVEQGYMCSSWARLHATLWNKNPCNRDESNTCVLVYRNYMCSCYTAMHAMYLKILGLGKCIQQSIQNASANCKLHSAASYVV